MILCNCYITHNTSLDEKLVLWSGTIEWYSLDIDLYARFIPCSSILVKDFIPWTDFGQFISHELPHRREFGVEGEGCHQWFLQWISHILHNKFPLHPNLQGEKEGKFEMNGCISSKLNKETFSFVICIHSVIVL